MSSSSRVFDIDAGLLDDELLSGQLRLLVGLVGGGRPRNAQTPAPRGWQGHEDALALRLNQVLEEVILRGGATPGRVSVTEESVIWPVPDPADLKDQLDKVRERAQGGLTGRIRMPRNDHELWATYKYSVLARNYRAYQSFGQRVAARSIAVDELWLSMVSASRVAPLPGGMRNALQHMWGYVSGFSTMSPQTEDLVGLAGEIQRLAVAHEVSYLLNSTALGELRAWL
ncbi:YbgA family protein [Marinobacter salicampi]|uniref:YbgA family protein n=1 Tax=Marinobacter salicampi TaxID=435907 RepID=UPI00140D9A3A|nr:YbgA family protein [Marinobacter salicampi]